MNKLFLWFILLFVLSPAAVFANEKDQVLQASRQQFGEPVDAARNLFEVNPFYVYRVDFDERNRVEKMEVEPKANYADDHPDWKKTAAFRHLSAAEYTSLLNRLEGIKSKGKTVGTEPFILLSGRRIYKIYEHETADLSVGYFNGPITERYAPVEIMFFSLHFECSKEKA